MPQKRRVPPEQIRPESPVLRALHDRFIGDDPERVESYGRALANARVAGAIHDMRTAAGLTRREPAARVGSSASVICRLEDADDEGHSLSMLLRVAEALDHEVEIRFTRKEPRPPKPSASGPIRSPGSR